MTDARVEAIVARCQKIEGIHWDNDTVARAEMVARETLTEAGPGGWKLVPVEPTEAMQAAYYAAIEERAVIREIWRLGYRAMLAASPSPSPAPTQASPPDAGGIDPLWNPNPYADAPELFPTPEPPPAEGEYEELVKALNASHYKTMDEVGNFTDDPKPKAAATAIQSLTGRVRELEAQVEHQATDAYRAAAEKAAGTNFMKLDEAYQAEKEARRAAEAALASERERALEDMRYAIEQTLELAANERQDEIGLGRALEIVRALKPKKEEGDA